LNATPIRSSWFERFFFLSSKHEDETARPVGSWWLDRHHCPTHVHDDDTDDVPQGHARFGLAHGPTIMPSACGHSIPFRDRCHHPPTATSATPQSNSIQYSARTPIGIFDHINYAPCQQGAILHEWFTSTFIIVFGYHCQPQFEQHERFTLHDAIIIIISNDHVS
jgi:hypothetical protein